MLFFSKKEEKKEIVKYDGVSDFVDVHSHILPHMDDGSDSLETTKLMLEKMKEQGITSVIATPHFYARHEDPKHFLKRRDEAVNRLKELKNLDLPEVYVGAEVAYFEGMGRCEDMLKLTIQGTKYLLVEMPFQKWTDRVLDDIEELTNTFLITPIIAHIERYIWMQPRKIVERLLATSVLIQSNAEAFLDKKESVKAFKLIDGGSIDFLGSDSHNLGERKPNLADGLNEIATRGYIEALNFMASRSRSIIRKAERIL